MIALAALLLALDAPPPAAAPPVARPAAEAPPALDPSRILVVPRKGTDVERAYAGLRAAGLLPVELEERAGVDRPAPAPPRPGTRDAARAHVEEAKARFRELDLDATRAAADEAVDEVLRLEHPEDARDVLIDALLLKADVALQAGVDEDARASLALVSRLDPGRAALHPGLYPPSLCDAYAAARAAEEAEPAASLVVRPRAAGFSRVDVLVDGRPFGSSPVRAGPHVVTARARDAVPFSRVVVLDPAEPTVLAPFLAPAGAASRRAALVARARKAATSVDEAHALARLADLCAARAVLFLDGPRAMLWSARGLQELSVSSKAGGAALGRATLLALQAPARKDDAPKDEGPDLATLAVAGSVGAVVVAGIVGVGLWALLPASSQPDPPRIVHVKCCGD